MQHTDLLSPPPPLLTVTGENPSHPVLIKGRTERCTIMLYKDDWCIKCCMLQQSWIVQIRSTLKYAITFRYL